MTYSTEEILIVIFVHICLYVCWAGSKRHSVLKVWEQLQDKHSNVM